MWQSGYRQNSRRMFERKPDTSMQWYVVHIYATSTQINQLWQDIPSTHGEIYKERTLLSQTFSTLIKQHNFTVTVIFYKF